LNYFLSHLDFIVLQADDGTYVYAIEEEEAEANDTDYLEKKATTKLIPSKGDIVGKLNLATQYEEVGAERVVVRNVRNSNKTKSDTRFARHHPQQLNKIEFEGSCFKQFCGGIPEPFSINLDGNNINGGRYLRKQNPPVDRESSLQVGSAQFHRRQSTLPTTGIVKNLVILLKFKDHEEQQRNLPEYDDIERLMDTLTDVYLKNSFGKLIIESTIIPEWYTTAHNEAWYAEGKSGTTNLHEAMREVLDYLEETDVVDLIDYDGNGNGYVDSVTFLHSGYGAEHGGMDCKGQDYYQRIWTHQWQLYGNSQGNNIGPWASNSTDPYGGNIKVWDYQMVSALKGVCGDTITPVGALAHEFGHTLGLPDLASGSGNGIGGFCLMADAWGFDETLEHPSQISAWAKLKLGWLEARTPTLGLNEIALAEEPSERTQLYKIGDGKFGFPKDEYLLIEYRARRGLDEYLPGEGLLIYHIDESPDVPNNVNEGHPWQNDDWPRNGKHYKVALVQADRLYSLERGINNGGEKDFFSAEYVNALVPSENSNAPWEGPFPNTDSYQNGKVFQTGVNIYRISSPGEPTMSFMFRGNLKDKLFKAPTKETETENTESLTEIDGYGNVGPDPPKKDRWKWKIDSSIDIGSLRYPVALGNALHNHQP
jgi:M6 family metalloprotease-like protein